jgi:PIN domain nuclease of toxin-antitoxin system
VSKVVVDSSLVLAVVYSEVGWEAAVEFLEDAVVSAVNAAEVQSKLVLNGMPPELAWETAMNAVPEVVDFSEEQARVAGDLILKTKEFGLSLGDRACLALGMVLGVPVCTTDRAWKSLKVGVKIHVIR